MSARVDEYVNAMNRARAATTQLSSESEANLRKVGGQMQNVGKWSTTHVSLPLIAAGGAALKMGYDFDQAFTKMVSLAGVAASEVDGLKESVQDLAHETARSPQELADALYFLRSSGLDGAEAMDALEMSAKASAAGLGDTAVIADAVSSAMNAYAMSGLSAAEATDVLVATARAGKAEPEQLAGALGRVLPIASELGVTFDDVGGAIASLSLTGNDASVSATLLFNVLSKLLKPSQQSAEALAAVGMSTGSIRQSIADNGLLGTLEQLRSQLGDAGFVKFLEDAQAVQGALSLTGENIEGVRDVFGQLDAAAGSTGEAFNKISQTDGFKLQQGLTDLKNAAVDMGDVLVPVAANVASGVGSLASAVGELPGPARTGVVALGGLAVAAGPVIWAAGTIVKNFREVGGAVRSISGRLHTAEGNLTTFGRAARVAGTALGALAAIELADTLVFPGGEQAQKLTERLQALTIAVGDLKSGAGDAEAAMSAFRQTVAAEGQHDLTLNPFTNLGHIAESIGDEITIVGSTAKRDIEQVDRAFQKLLDQDPAQAQMLLNIWREMATTQLAPGSDQLEDNLDAIDRYQTKIDLTVGSQNALAGATDQVTLSTTAGTSAYVDYGAAVQRTADGIHAASEAAKEHVTALQEEIDALEKGRDALQGMLDARLGYADASVGYDRAQDRMLETLRDVPAAVKEAKGDQLALNDVYRDAADAVAAAADADVEKWRTSLEGAGATLAEADALDIRNRALLNAIPAWQGDREALIERIALVNGIDDEKATTIVTIFDEFGADAAMVALNEISETREVAVQVDETNSTIDGKMQDLESAEYTAEVLVDADTHWAEQAIAAVENGNYTATVKIQPQYGVIGGLPGPPAPGYGQPGGLPGPPAPPSAVGRYAASAMFGLFGEDGAEWIAPLTKPNLMRSWLNDPRIRGPVTAALGIPGFAGGGIIGRVLQVGGSTTSGVMSESARMSNMHEVGALSDSGYRDYLAAQMEGLEQFSDEWMQVWREIKSLDDDEIRRQDEKAKAAKEQADAVIAEEDRKMAALYETGVISNAQYEQYLQSRLGDYEQYSADWMEKWRELSGIQEQAERDAVERRQKEAEDALRRLEVLYSAAENRHRLSVAESDLADSWNDVDEARREVADAEDDAGRVRAERQVADALNRVADDAWEGAKARAAVNGFAEGTADWGRFMRSEVGAYIGAHPELAGRLNQWLESVPRFAAGGHAVGWGIAGENGAELINFGAGANVYNADLSRAMMSAASLGGGGDRGAEGLLRQIVTRLDRLEGGVNFNGPISVGTRDDLRALRSEADRMLWKMRVGG